MRFRRLSRSQARIARNRGFAGHAIGLGLALLVFSYQAPPAPYQGDIRESDPRVREILAKIRSSGTGQPPQELRLRYGGPRGDYLAFYDLEGRDVYFRYREDRFDRRAEKKVGELIAGQGYRVRGEYRGLLIDGVFIAPGAEGYGGALENPGVILAYDYRSVVPLRLEQILY